MKFIREHIALFLVFIMSAFCLWSSIVAVKITLVMIERRDQVITAVPAVQGEIDKSRGNAININKLKDCEIIFNGKKIDGLVSYLNNKEIFVPIDEVLYKAGVIFKYYDTDNIFEWEYKGIKNHIKLGEDGLWLGKNRLNLSSRVIAARNHILVPLELFGFLDGFSYKETADLNLLIINLFPEYDKKLGSVNFLGTKAGKTSISDVLDKKLIWSPKGSTGVDSVERAPSSDKYLIKSGNKVYLLSNNSMKPEEINADPSAHWCENKKYLYWINSDNKMLFIYNTENDTSREIGDDYRNIKALKVQNNKVPAIVLTDYKRGADYERMDFSINNGTDSYSFIKRGGKIVLEGKLVYSPDKRRVVYYIQDEGYYFAYSDGTYKRFLGNASDIKWVTNHKIFMARDNKKYLVKNNGKTITETDKDWKYLGRTDNGEVLFSINDNLYSEKDGEETEIMSLPWICDSIYAKSAAGPYIAAVKSEAGLFFINHQRIERLCDLNEEKTKVSSLTDTYKLSFSRDGRYLSFLREEDKLLGLNIIDTLTLEQKRVLLDMPLNPKALSVKWISGSLILVYTETECCAVNIDKGFEIYDLKLPESRYLAGIINK